MASSQQLPVQQLAKPERHLLAWQALQVYQSPTILQGNWILLSHFCHLADLCGKNHCKERLRLSRLNAEVLDGSLASDCAPL